VVGPALLGRIHPARRIGAAHFFEATEFLQAKISSGTEKKERTMSGLAFRRRFAAGVAFAAAFVSWCFDVSRADEPPALATALANASSQEKAGVLAVATVTPARDSEAHIEAVLSERTELDFTDQPLSDVIDYLKSRHEIEIQFDDKALTEVGLSHDAAVSRRLKGITLRSALNLILGNLDLDYAIRDEVLLITTKSAMHTMRELRVYPVGDLVRSSEDDDDKEAGQEPDYEPLLEAVCTTLGEDAEICAYPLTSSLIVNASLAGQRQVQRLFDLLRQERRTAKASQ
jgi:hypothetical protein